MSLLNVSKIYRFFVNIDVKFSLILKVTRYGLEDGRGIESRWGQYFLHQSNPTLTPTQLPINWVPGFPPGMALTTHPYLAPRLKKV